MKKARMDVRINFVCTAALYAALVARAEKEGLPLSTIIRQTIAKGLAK